VYPNGRITNIKGCDFGTITNQEVEGGTFAPVAPKIKGQYSEEVVAGIQYDVGLDLVLGASYVHRDLGRVIEDVSPDGGHNYFITNPGDDVDKDTLGDLRKKINATTDPEQKAALQQTLQLYQQINVGYPKPKRNYDALVLTANKRLSHNFLLLASYTYSRTIGNYPGLFQPSNGQTDPNISSQYDQRDLLVNRDGPLPYDRPHNLKVTGSYFVPFGGNTLVFGLAFNMASGRPIEVLGYSPQVGASQVFLLPRGSGGRTPLVSQLDFHVSYKRDFAHNFAFEAYWDIFNLANQQQITDTDDNYTYSIAGPILNGQPSDLRGLKAVDGKPVVVNPNFGQATAYQAPLSMRVGLRLSF
jgi:hypothetical protein